LEEVLFSAHELPRLAERTSLGNIKLLDFPRKRKERNSKKDKMEDMTKMFEVSLEAS